MNRKEKQEQVKFLKHEMNSPKEELMRLRDRLMEVSPSQAEKLGVLIGRLEDFQNK